GFNASTTIKRSDFGVSYMLPGIPDEMNINLFVEGVRK
ncbi:MAG: YceI family protein, partial [Aeromonas veronii]